MTHSLNNWQESMIGVQHWGRGGSQEGFFSGFTWFFGIQSYKTEDILRHERWLRRRAACRTLNWNWTTTFPQRMISKRGLPCRHCCDRPSSLHWQQSSAPLDIADNTCIQCPVAAWGEGCNIKIQVASSTSYDLSV